MMRNLMIQAGGAMMVIAFSMAVSIYVVLLVIMRLMPDLPAP